MMITFGKTNFWQKSCIRKLFITDLPEYRAHLLRLGCECRRSRFGNCVNDEILTIHARDCFQGNALVFAYIENGVVRGAAEFRPFNMEAERRAEIAFSVEEAWQRQGIGTALFEKLIVAASNRNIASLVMQCLPENQAMQNLALQFHAKINFDFEERIGTISNLHPTVLSLTQEATDDWRSVLGAFTHIQKSVWSPRAPANDVRKLSA